MASFRFIEDSFEEVKNNDFFDKIALVAHNCYQVKEKDHESNILFIGRLIKSGHLAMIEHYRFTFALPASLYQDFLSLHHPFFELGEYMKKKGNTEEMVYLLSCSLRPILEGLTSQDVLENRLSRILASSLPQEIVSLLPPFEKEEVARLIPLEEIADKIPAEIYERFFYVTYHLVTDRGVTHELVRHRLCSFAQESTRYCNYTKEKFSSCLTFLKPPSYEQHKDLFDAYYQKTADTYFALIEAGATPDEARAVLPNSLKASIMVTCSLKEWKNIFALRTDSHAHFDIRRLMIAVKEDMKKKGYLQ